MTERAFDAGELDLAELTLADVGLAADLAERYADLGLGGTDASIAAIAERLFGFVRPKHVDAFTLLPADC